MKHIFFSLAALSLPLMGAEAPQNLPGGWELSWNDEFNGNKLDESKWDYELGVVRNNGSSQAYTKQNVEVKGGLLRIHSRFEKTPNVRYDATKDKKGEWNCFMPERPYSSGSITTKGRKNFEYGRVEVRARLPRAKGCWPAIWLLGDNGWGWPANGEIDMMEHLTQHPGLCYSTIHWGAEGSKKPQSKGFTRMLNFIYDEFHVYSMEWDKDELAIFVNDVEIGKWKLDMANYPDGRNPFRTPQYMILNTAIGGPGTWPEQPDAAEYPAVFEVDYVRYYTRKEAAKPKAPTAPPTKLEY